ncbi:TMEM175 family protein [Micromonospora soli]|uniref:TMEM175 family protein n=1 Tax=Micromonospora sp. NBRC 110009 TaxID=3061627 RepID=UPI002673F10A|nr:TMEM175 family protein [Micromonospora sp. NBRC 110009]WKT97046.1 TMEM175 family protein [Micromonospora sp. NBRC 110009]
MRVEDDTVIPEGSRAGAATQTGRPARSELEIVNPERLVFFSDAVVAIAITLLALELPVPVGQTDTELWRDLARNLNEYVAFLISFAVIGGHWFLHHRTFGHVARLSGRLVRWNMLWLLMIVLTPFVTRVIVGDGAFAARFTLYAATQALASLSFLLAVLEMDRHGLARAGTPRSLFANGYRMLSVAAGAFAVSIPLAFVTHWAYACWAVIPFVARVGRLADAARRRPGRAAV